MNALEYIELLKEHGIWLADQAISSELQLQGKPVTDSRLVAHGDSFFCIRGLQSDGHKYISEVLAKGAGLIIQQDAVSGDYPAIRVTDSRQAAALMAKLYYQNPTARLILIGITGTNGKTTTSMLIWQALRSLGYNTGWIGTLGYRINEEIFATNNTTPDIMELNQIFRLMADSGCHYVVMEVSSHALALDRVYGLEYDLALFTNLSRDHLDFHADMTDYAESKYQLFANTIANDGISLINTDDSFGKVIYDRLHAIDSDKVYSISGAGSDFKIKNAVCTIQNSKYDLIQNGGTVFPIQTVLCGEFNVKNTAMACAALLILLPDMKMTQLFEIAAGFTPVRGRLESVANDRGIGIYVDYAHTPDAIGTALSALKQLKQHRILTVFGAGGNRDKGKRPLMLQAALAMSDAVIITNDNPRDEDPGEIIRDIIQGCDLWQPWWIIRDRYQAIEAALRLAVEGDIILIAGKGHETYQETKGVKQHFDDVEVVQNVLQKYQPYPVKNQSKPVEQDADPAKSENKIPDPLVLPVDAMMMELLCDSEFIYFTDADRAARELYHSISTDSRTMHPGSLYIAIRGERFDGADYVPEVLAQPTNGAVVNAPFKSLPGAILVSDTLEAYGKLAKKYLTMFAAYRIALTGSTGKTTTKEFLANIFAQKGAVLKTLANENNLIGLCQTIFRIKPEDKTAILELGTNHFGEIAALAGICTPQTAMITNIGASHLEHFGDEAGVYREKTAIFRAGQDKILFPGDDERFADYRSKGISVGFGDNCSYKISELQQETTGINFRLNKTLWHVPQFVPFYVTNLAFAIATALEAGMTHQAIQAGLNKKTEAALRMQIEQIGQHLVIADCYNANPVSMRAAIEFWAAYHPELPHLAILGDMLELGSNSHRFHQDIGSILQNTRFENLITVGSLSLAYRTGSALQERSQHYQCVEDLIAGEFISHLPEQAVILLKASHGIHLERLLPVISSHFSKRNA